MLYLLFVALVSAAVLGVVSVALRGRSDRPWTYAAWAAMTTAALFLTLWLRPTGTGLVRCTVSKDVLESFGTTQGWMNVALFVPIGFLGVRAARRPLPPLLLSVLLACGIETVQACLPVIGRYCDTSDFVTNVAGAAVGAGVGMLSLRLAGSTLSPWPVRHRGFVAVSGAGFVAVAAVLSTVVDVRLVDHAEPNRPASARQRALIEQAVRTALGDDVRITDVSDNTPCGVDGVNEEVWAELQPPGTAFIRWPQQDEFQLDVSTGSRTRAAAVGRPIPGADGPVRDEAAAERTAGRYVAAHYPTADTKRPAVDRADEVAGATWTVTYPYRDGRMPAVRSLEVRVNSAGRLLGVRLAAPAGSTPVKNSGSCV
ncbi:VanZ family protein [Streptomyces sp. ME19-03-3]|nr:VanZ family protein [Streptomyces sp. ME19-03-3]